jgi:hypothetical protein
MALGTIENAEIFSFKFIISKIFGKIINSLSNSVVEPEPEPELEPPEPYNFDPRRTGTVSLL